MTLIELLAVVALLALIAVVGVGIAARTSESHHLRNIVASIQRLDARARLLAQSRDSVRLTVSEQRAPATLLEAIAGSPQSDPMVLGRVDSIPDQFEFMVVDPSGDRLDEIVYDAFGGSVDFDVVVSSRSGWAQLSIAGLTGWSSISMFTSGFDPEDRR